MANMRMKHVNIDEDTHRILKKLAYARSAKRYEDVSIGRVIKEVLEDYLKSNKNE